ncbi:inner membrane protein YjeT [Klebsiella variicola]|nr:inner membrane protein YjeT [Klebsiella variicola]
MLADDAREGDDNTFQLGLIMNSTIWLALALALVLVLEGLGPLLYPRAWRKMVASLSQLPDNLLRRFGGGLVVAGIVIYYMLRKSIG